MIACRLLTSPEEIRGIEAAWRDLDAAFGDHLSTHPALFSAWADTLAAPEGWRPLVVAGWEDGKLVALLPLAVTRSKGFRLLRGAANGVYFQTRSLTQNQAFVPTLWKTALASPGYDLLWVEAVPEGSPDFSFLADTAKITRHSPCFFSDLRVASGEAWLDARSSKWRGSLRRGLRTLEKKGQVSVEIYRDETVPAEALAAFLSHKRAWCREKDAASYILHPEAGPFLRALLDRLHASGALLFAVLSCDGVPIAWNFCMTSGKKVFCLMMAHDPAWSSCSPGSLVWMKTIFWAIENGFEGYDMMQYASPQKESFASATSEVADFRKPRNLRGVALDALLRLRSLRS